MITHPHNDLCIEGEYSSSVFWFGCNNRMWNCRDADMDFASIRFENLPWPDKFTGSHRGMNLLKDGHPRLPKRVMKGGFK